MRRTVFVRSAVLDSELQHAELSDTFRRAAAQGDSNRVTDPLRAEGVDRVEFVLDETGELRITPVGLESHGRPHLSVEARVRVLTSPRGTPRIRITVGVTNDSWLGVVGGPIVLVALGVWQLLQDPPSFGSFYVLIGAAALFAAVGLVRVRGLVERAWPGFEAMAGRIARGSFYVPT